MLLENYHYGLTELGNGSEELLSLLLCFVSAVIICLFSIPSIIKLAIEKRLATPPCSRSAHQVDTPSFGGVAIFMAFLFNVLLWVDLNTLDEPFQYIIFALAALFFIGMKDDLLVISPRKKFAAQFLAAAVVVVFGNIRIDDLQGVFGLGALPEWAAIGFSITFFVFVINAYNLIDGIDGLAGGLGMITSLFLSIFFIQMHEMAYGVMTLALAGALLGFLRFNFSPRKKIFMGDTGSMLVGFLLALFITKFLSFSPESFYSSFGFYNSPAVAVCLLIVPIFDTLRVFTVRLLNGKSPFFPDKNHIHHYLLSKQMSHAQASAVLYAANIFAILISMAFLHDLNITILFVLFIGLLLVSSIFNYRGSSGGKQPIKA